MSRVERVRAWAPARVDRTNCAYDSRGSPRPAAPQGWLRREIATSPLARTLQNASATMNIKKTVIAIGLAASVAAGLLAAPGTASAGGSTSDTLNQILAKCDEILAAIESSTVDLGGVTPTWDKALPAQTRFTAVLGGTAYRDNNTGLVWEAAPTSLTFSWDSARFQCINHTTGGVKGWRLPMVHELASLIDPTRSNPALPAGHPFANVVVSYNGYWTESTDTMGPNVAWALNFIDGFIGLGDKSYSSHIWCVRGASGAAHY